MKKISLSLCVAMMMMGVMMVPASATAQEKRTYVFAQRDSALRLDVWSPEVARADRACVVALFGGGFVEGERDNELQREIARLLTGRGYTVVSPDYRLGLKDTAHNKQYKGLSGVADMFQWTIDMAAEDCAEAVAWTVAHAGELNINPERMVLTGCSAGAITVAQLDYYRCNGESESGARVSSLLPQGWKPSAVVPYAGAVMTKGKPKYKTAPAPTMFMHGMKDKIVAYKRFPQLMSHALRGGSTLFDVFKKEGYPVWIVRFEGIGHEVASFLPGSVDLFCGFVEQVFNGCVTTLDATMSDKSLVPTKFTDMTVIDLYK